MRAQSFLLGRADAGKRPDDLVTLVAKRTARGGRPRRSQRLSRLATPHRFVVHVVTFVRAKTNGLPFKCAARQPSRQCIRKRAQALEGITSGPIPYSSTVNFLPLPTPLSRFCPPPHPPPPAP